MLAACVGPQRPAPPPPGAAGSIEGLAAAIAADAKRSDREADSKVRADLATDAGAAADACLARESQAVACLYGRAIALGLAARVHPTRAGELLNAMLGSLAGAEAADPLYDEAGPARVRALVLIRAPGWPLGPGDAEGALVAARRAVSLRPEYPPNQLALAEALGKTGDSGGARDAYDAARTRAQGLADSADRSDWLREADEALRRLRSPQD
jgi:predicted Zn-dependent protease